jgi:hypothetical protein
LAEPRREFLVPSGLITFTDDGIKQMKTSVSPL